jgi:glycosyltransferase involved in cell wall biosynthesis
MRVLYLSDWFPFPADNGIKARTLNLIKSLSRRHVVDLVSFTPGGPSDEQLKALQPYCRTVLVEVARPYDPRSPKALLGFFSSQPRSVVDSYSPAMMAAVRRAATEFAPEVVIAAEISMAPYALAVPGLPRILEGVELSTLYESNRRAPNLFKRLRSRLTWWKHARYVGRSLRAFDACTVASELEQKRVRRVAPHLARIAIVPNGADLEHNRFGCDQAEPDSLIYSGALTYQANFEAVDYFLRDIFPLVQARRPGARLCITGELSGVPTERLSQYPGITFTGYLEDIRPSITRSMVSVVPLRSGGGTRLKILESLALGTPVVATPKGAEGLELTPGRDLLIAEQPADFAEAVLSLLAEPGLRETLRLNGRRAVEAKYNFATIGETFCALTEAVVAEAGPAARHGRQARDQGQVRQAPKSNPRDR